MPKMNNKQRETLTRKALKLGGWRLVKVLSKSVPYAGTVIAIGLVGQSVRNKGLVKGAVNSGLDAIPIVGTVKNVAEFFVGDFLPDKVSIEESRRIAATNRRILDKYRKENR